MNEILCFKHAGMTDRGCVRNANADYVGSFLPASPAEELTAGSLFLVADGVGSAEDGRKAGKIAVHHIFSNYYENSIVDPQAHLRAAIDNTNLKLYEMSKESGLEGSHATTIVAALIYRKTVFFAAVGDSRAYFIHNDVIEQVTADHTLVNHLIKKGAITEKEALTHPKRNVITRSLGVREFVKIDLFERNPIAGDMAILCSDGLSRYVEAQELLERSSDKDIQLLPEMFIDLAKGRGGRDNISVYVIQFTGVEVP